MRSYKKLNLWLVLIVAVLPVFVSPMAFQSRRAVDKKNPPNAVGPSQTAPQTPQATKKLPQTTPNTPQTMPKSPQNTPQLSETTAQPQEAMPKPAMDTDEEGEAPAPPRNDAKRFVCYYRWNLNNVTTKNIPPGCTHIVLSTALVTSDSGLNLSQVASSDEIKKFVESYKRDHPQTRILICVSGKEGFANSTKTEEGRVKLLDAISDLLSKADMDGVDINWESPEDRVALGSLLTEAKTKLKALGETTGKDYDLSIVLPGPFTLAWGLPHEIINETCTFATVSGFNLLLWDGYWVKAATLHSALKPQTFFLHPYAWFSVRDSIASWTSKVARAKLNLGFPSFAVAYELCDTQKTVHMSCVRGFSPLGANVDYDKVCELRKQFPDNEKRESYSGAPYIYDDKGNWMSYDDPIAVLEKVEFAKKEQLGGLMIFTVNADDPAGVCGESHPLMKAALSAWTAAR